MIELLNLGRLHISDFLAPGEQPRSEPYELRLMMDEDNLVHLASQPPAELMWGERYWYRSGTTETMRRELGDVVTYVNSVVNAEPGDVWVDIASNDGTLLSHVPKGWTTIGVDPVWFADMAGEFAEAIIQQPFGSDVGDEIISTYGHARVVTCIAMFYDLLEPGEFLAAAHALLDRNGVLVLQLSYTPLMIRQLAFDNICHEHARYYTLSTLRATLRAAGLRLIDCELNAVNGGSMRVLATRFDADHVGTMPWRGVADARIESILIWEHDYDSPAAWRRFAGRVADLREEVQCFVDEAHRRGERVWGCGASTKGNTLLQYFGLDHTHIGAIGERQPEKWGLRTVGSDIPIVSEEEMRLEHPEYLLVLPWHFQHEIVAREQAYLEAGGRLVFPCPTFEVVG